MNLDFSDDQKFLQDEARKFFDKEGGLTNTRKVMDESLSHDAALWGKVLELGWTGIRIPEEYDGLGLGHLELCVIAEEIGRALAPIPFSSSVYLFTETIIKYGSEEIKKNGCLISEFNPSEKPTKYTFPKRNRIIAGISTATLIVETPYKGGAMITARMANDYNKDVFSIPGNIKSKQSQGCHQLIKNNQAHLISSAEDIINLMGLEPKPI